MDIVIPIVTAAIGAIGGYLGKARLAAAELQKVHAENEGLKAEREEKHFQHRQGVYHEMLNLDNRLRKAYTQGHRDPVMQTFDDQALRELSEHVNGVAIFGKADVRSAAERLLLAHQQRDDKAMQLIRDQLIDAMRRDVAPN